MKREIIKHRRDTFNKTRKKEKSKTRKALEISRKVNYTKINTTHKNYRNYG